MARQITPIPDARPFVKWTGGKTKLLCAFFWRFPPRIRTGKITGYVESFVSGSAVFFTETGRFSFKRCTICDANEELILAYRVILMAVNLLIRELETLGSGYLPGDQDGREAVYYAIRDAFNRKKPEIDYTTCCRDGVARAAQLIFLNRTCYSGHFQVNCQGGFNVPIGRYANPEILFEDNLRNVATVLERTRIINADFTQCSDFDNDTTFVYPSYSPLNGTASLTSYSMEGFFDGDPVRLARFIRTLDATGAKLMLSNSDPRNDDPADSFFEDLCAGYRIERVPARRIINCNGARCGEIRELVITHYRPARLSCGYCFPRPIVSTTPFPAVPAIRFTGEHAFASGIPN